VAEPGVQTLPLDLAPEASAPGGVPTPFRLRPEELPSALNPISGHYFDRARSLPADRVQLGKWSSIRVSRPVFLLGRQACVSQHLCSEKWNPVLELHQPLRICRPPPELIGQRDDDLRRRIRGRLAEKRDVRRNELNPSIIGKRLGVDRRDGGQLEIARSMVHFRKPFQRFWPGTSWFIFGKSGDTRILWSK
jgi:hypothetical protein